MSTQGRLIALAAGIAASAMLMAAGCSASSGPDKNVAIPSTTIASDIGSLQERLVQAKNANWSADDCAKWLIADLEATASADPQGKLGWSVQESPGKETVTGKAFRAACSDVVVARYGSVDAFVAFVWGQVNPATSEWLNRSTAGTFKPANGPIK